MWEPASVVAGTDWKNPAGFGTPSIVPKRNGTTNEGAATTERLTRSPSGSLAETPEFWKAGTLSTMFAGALIRGASLTEFTVIPKDFVSSETPSVTRTVPVAVPDIPEAGARVIVPVAVPVPGTVVATVMYVGPETFENCSGWPSPSVAVIVWTAVAVSSTTMSAI